MVATLQYVARGLRPGAQAGGGMTSDDDGAEEVVLRPADPLERALVDAALPPPWTPPSWEQVVREHSGRVYRLAYRLTGNGYDAEEKSTCCPRRKGGVTRRSSMGIGRSFISGRRT